MNAKHIYSERRTGFSFLFLEFWRPLNIIIDWRKLLTNDQTEFFFIFCPFWPSILFMHRKFHRSGPALTSSFCVLAVFCFASYSAPIIKPTAHLPNPGSALIGLFSVGKYPQLVVAHREEWSCANWKIAQKWTATIPSAPKTIAAQSVQVVYE